MMARRMLHFTYTSGLLRERGRSHAQPGLQTLPSLQPTGAPRPYHYSNDYIHAPTMYNLTAMKNRKLKFGLGVFGGVAAGILIPLFACCHQQSKAKGSSKQLKAD